MDTWIADYGLAEAAIDRVRQARTHRRLVDSKELLPLALHSAFILFQYQRPQRS